MNLTELELFALRSHVVNLSDGHARQSLGEQTRTLLSGVFAEVLTCRATDYFEAECRFLHNLSRHTGQNYRRGRCFITYSSSSAMGEVATYLKQSGRRVGLICPTFDNIPGILASLNVPVVPIAEERFVPECDLDHLDSLRIGALILVTPNNPTGTRFSRKSMCSLMDWAARARVQLILDLAFRCFDPGMEWDIVAEADRRGADVVTIDDTGKVLSLADLKVGVISTSARMAEPIRRVHTQYVLNVSELVLRVLSAVMDPDRADNEVSRARTIVHANRRYLDANLKIVRQNSSAISVAWLCLPRCRDQIVRDCRNGGLEVLVGDYFHWATPSSPPADYIRLALMRDTDYFARGVDILARVLADREVRCLANIDDLPILVDDPEYVAP